MGAPAASPGTRPSLLKTASFLWAASIAGFLLLIPYLLALQAQAIGLASAATGLSSAGLMLVSLLQVAVLMAAVSFGGLWAARRLGLGVPVLETMLAGLRVTEEQLRWLRSGAAIGVLAGLMILLADRLVFPPLAPAGATPLATPAAWKGLLASFYGALNEELLLRLGMLSLLGLLARWLVHGPRDSGSGLPAGAFWVANALTALLFAAAHLPAMAAIAAWTAINVAHVLVLNALAGAVFGWLYWRGGLESAMCGHLCADIILHALGPLLI